MLHSSSRRIKGLSKAVSRHGFKRGVRYTVQLRAADQAARLQAIKDQCAAEIQGTRYFSVAS